jgi:hypothetical protein
MTTIPALALAECAGSGCSLNLRVYEVRVLQAGIQGVLFGFHKNFWMPASGTPASHSSPLMNQERVGMLRGGRRENNDPPSGRR